MFCTYYVSYCALLKQSLFHYVRIKILLLLLLMYIGVLNSIICDIRHEARICSIIILTLFYNNTAAYSG